MTELKTQPTDKSVLDFIDRVKNSRRKDDALVLLNLFANVTGQPAVIWGDSIIGFGTYTYALANGSQQTFLRSGFSPRKQNLSIYVGAGMSEHPHLLTSLGKHKTSKACLYINKLADIDMAVLEQIIQTDLEVMNQRYPA
ncbi:DUF1801 domain-containing protein [Aliiglaciecola litoralis]|uniref:YdhG-like domain-containing protein n=1 Tax=Aliiglaciecola litoralis TaxID=582857 RepID=A0ABN1LCM9_9ALTE